MYLGTARMFTIFLLINWLTLPGLAIALCIIKGFAKGIGFFVAVVMLDGLLSGFTGMIDKAVIAGVKEMPADPNDLDSVRVSFIGGILMILGILSHVAFPIVSAIAVYVYY